MPAIKLIHDDDTSPKIADRFLALDEQVSIIFDMPVPLAVDIGGSFPHSSSEVLPRKSQILPKDIT